jgi:hypothetical protein
VTGTWRDSLQLQFEDFVDGLVVRGAKQDEIYDAIIEEIGKLRAVNDRDPDPSDDRPGAEAEDPSNEWHGAVP